MGSQTLAQAVRAKHPGAYDDLSDQELEAKIDAKYPGVYADLGRTAAKPSQPPNVGRGFGHLGRYVAPPEHENVAQRLKRGVFETWKDATDFYFGPEDREMQEAAGRKFELSEGQVMGMAGMAAGPAIGEVAGAAGRALSGAGGKAAAWAAAHPRVTNAAIGAVPGILRRDPHEALTGAAIGAIATGRAAPAAAAEAGAARAEAGAVAASARAAPVVMSSAEATAQINALQAAGKMEESRALIEAIRSKSVTLTDSPAIRRAVPIRSASTSGAAPLEPVYVPSEPIPLRVEAPAGPQRPSGPHPGPGNVKPATIHQPEGTSYTLSPAERRAAQEAAAGADLGEQLQRSLDRGKAASTAHREVMGAAKAAVEADPTAFGEKVWIALDGSGKPAGTFKSEPAARAAAKKIGGATTWAKNLWLPGGIN